MIKLLRLDERLIHGQIAVKWSRYLDVDRIIVANDDAANNSIVQKSLLMAAPSTCKTAIKTIDGAIKLMNDPRAVNLKILVVASNPKDVIKILTNVKEINDVNIGNYGRVALKRGNEVRKTYANNLYAYDDEVEDFKKILAFNKNVYYQTTPDETPEKLEKVLGL